MVPHPAFVVEPQTIFVDRLDDVLRAAGFDVVAVSKDLDADAIAAAAPELVFIDPDFAFVDPREAVRTLLTVAPQALVCVYTQRCGGELGRACVAAGARCVVSKHAGEDEIVAILKEVSLGGTYVDRRVDRCGDPGQWVPTLREPTVEPADLPGWSSDGERS
jgi:DNA-binding NarL/FixJ family response regulator